MIPNVTPRIAVGDTVRVHAFGYHRRHGEVGVVTYVRGTIGVEFDGHDYGFLRDELILVAKAGVFG